MKRFLAILFLLSMGLSSNATALFPYQTNVQQIQGVVQSKGDNDYILLPALSEDNFFDDFLGDFSNFNSLFLTSVTTTMQRTTAQGNVRDPYILPINNVNYVMVKDKNTNDWSERDLLGIDDPKDNMFLSLRRLESDNDYSKITSAELKQARIRLVRLNDNGVLLVNDRSQDYSLNKIDYIDMLHLRQTANSKETGIFGHFNVYLDTNDVNKMIVGFVTFDTDSKLQIMFEK